jgi:predicted nucleotidyltransferase
MGFDELVPRSIEIDLDGRPLRVLSLEMIVALKKQSTAPKDRLVLAVLEETLRRGRG